MERFIEEANTQLLVHKLLNLFKPKKFADPFDYPQQFGDLKIGLQIEELYRYS